MEKIPQWFTSKTFWLNLIGIVLAILALASQSFPIDAKVVTFVIGVGNILLRFLDGQPIMIGSKKFGKEETRVQ